MILEVASKLDDYESNSKNIAVNTSQLMKFNTVIYKIQTSSDTRLQRRINHLFQYKQGKWYMQNKEKVTCGEIRNKKVKHTVLKSTTNSRQYFEKNLSALPWWRHCVSKKLRKALFTVATIDDVDHDPSSTTAKSSFYGTITSMYQRNKSKLPYKEFGYGNKT